MYDEHIEKREMNVRVGIPLSHSSMKTKESQASMLLQQTYGRRKKNCKLICSSRLGLEQKERNLVWYAYDNRKKNDVSWYSLSP